MLRSIEVTFLCVYCKPQIAFLAQVGYPCATIISAIPSQVVVSQLLGPKGRCGTQGEEVFALTWNSLNPTEKVIRDPRFFFRSRWGFQTQLFFGLFMNLRACADMCVIRPLCHGGDLRAI